MQWRHQPMWIAIVLSVGVPLASCGTGPHAPKRSTSTTSTGPSPTSIPSTTTSAAHATVGQSVTVAGLSITLVKVVDPLQLGPGTELNPGQRAVGVDLLVTNPGSQAASQDIASGLTVYDSRGEAYEPNVAVTLNGVPNFPTGTATVRPGGSVTGWLEVQLPLSDPISTVVVTVVGPSSQSENATWAVTGS